MCSIIFSRAFIKKNACSAPIVGIQKKLYSKIMSISVGLYFFVFRMADDYLYVRCLYNIIIHDILGATDAK